MQNIYIFQWDAISCIEMFNVSCMDNQFFVNGLELSRCIIIKTSNPRTVPKTISKWSWLVLYIFLWSILLDLIQCLYNINARFKHTINKKNPVCLFESSIGTHFSLSLTFSPLI